MDLTACTIDQERRLVLGHTGGEGSLTEQEHGSLAFQSERAGKTVARDELLEQMWGYSTKVETRAIDVAVRRLGAKIEADPASTVQLIAVRGAGYRFEGPVRAIIARAPSLPAERGHSTAPVSACADKLGGGWCDRDTRWSASCSSGAPVRCF